MSFSDVSGVSSHFVTPNEGFSTTTSGTTASGATSVGLNSVAGLTNGAVFIGVIEPAGTKEQIFTGVVDTNSSQITSVVWTKGANIDHATGVSVVDYDTGTALKMITKGIKVQHNQDGSHGAVTATSVNASGALTGSSLVNATHTHTNAAGGGTLGTNSVPSAAVQADAITDAKLIYGKVRSRLGGNASNWQTAGTTSYDYSGTDVFVQTGVNLATASPTTITFPTAFNQIPIVIAMVNSAVAVNCYCYVLGSGVTTTTFQVQVVTDTGAANNAQSVAWIALGV